MPQFKKQRDKLREVWGSFPVPTPEPVQHGDYPIRVPKRFVKGRKGRQANSVSNAAWTKSLTVASRGAKQGFDPASDTQSASRAMFYSDNRWAKKHGVSR